MARFVLYTSPTDRSGSAGRLAEAVAGVRFASPRGPFRFDPTTHAVVQDVYVRRVQKVDGKYFNVEFDKLAKVKDPGKS